MLRIKNIAAIAALSTVMFGAGITVATVALSYLPMVNASSTKIAQGVKQSKTEAIDEERNLKFQFQDCKRTNQTIICNVLATNLNNENKGVQFHANWGRAEGDSRAVDTSGNEYTAKLIKIGQKENSTDIQTELIAGVPTKISLSFLVPREVTKLAVVELGYWTSTKLLGKAPFRDITIGASQVSNPSNPENCTCPPKTNPKKPRSSGR